MMIFHSDVNVYQRVLGVEYLITVGFHMGRYGFHGD